MAGYLKAPRDGGVDSDPTPVSGTPAVQNRRRLPPQTGMGPSTAGIERQRVVPGAPVTVLLVDDEPALLRTTQRLLEQRGLSVVSVDTAEAALELLSSSRSFDLLMTDVALRRTKGTELAERARRLRPALRVLFVSGFDEDCVNPEGPGGREAFLAKPYTARELDDRLRDLLLPAAGSEALEKAASAGVTSRDRVR
jgi:CheY-like chemotaxis protein